MDLSKPLLKPLTFYAMISLVVLVALFSGARTTAAADEPYVDVHYNYTYGSETYNSYNAESNNYKFQYGFTWGGANGLWLPGKSTNLLSTVGSQSMVPAIKVSGVWYSPVSAANGSNKMLVSRAGKNMWQISAWGLQFKSSTGATLPLTADQTFYYWNDKIYLVTEFNVTGTITGIESAEVQTYLNQSAFNRYNNGGSDTAIPSSGTWTSGAISNQVTVFHNSADNGSFTYQVINTSGTESLILQSGNYGPTTDGRLAIAQRAYDKDVHGGATGTWTNGQKHKVHTQFLVSPTNGSSTGITDTTVELNPLNASQFQLLNSLPYAGSRFLGYDNTMGAYVIEQYPGPRDAFYQVDPSQYPSVNFEIENDSYQRNIRLKTQLAIVNVNGYASGVTGGTGILTDANMVPNGIPVQISKKWDNTDPSKLFSSYVESYANFPVSPSSTTNMWHRYSMHNWGDHVNVGLPSLDITDYFDWGFLWVQTNIGQSEVIPNNTDNPGNATLTDFRAINGLPNDIGGSGPWFSNTGGHEFLKLNTGSAWNDAKRNQSGIRFSNRGPNLSEIDYSLGTRGGIPQVKATVKQTLLPSTKGTRVFYKIRYDFLSDHSFSNLNQQLSLFSLSDLRYSSPTSGNIAYLNNSGSVVTQSINHNNTFNITGAALSAAKPWVSLYNNTGNGRNNYGAVIQSFNGVFNGTATTSLALSMYATTGNQMAHFVPNVASNSIKAGDYAELEVELFTWHPDDGDYAPLQTEAAGWPTAVSVTTGTLVSQFPATIQVDSSENNDFTLTGGVDLVPVTVTGFNHYSKPQLQKYVGGSWQDVNPTFGINDGWQTDLDATTGKYKFTFIVPASPTAVRYRVVMVTATTPTFPTAIPVPTYPSGSINPTNLALGKSYDASTSWSSSFDAQKAFDGNPATRWSASLGSSSNQWLEVDLGSSTRFNRIVLDEQYANGQIQSYNIQYSNDGTNWVPIPTTHAVGLGPSPVTIDLWPTAARFVRLYVNTANGWPTIKEFAIYNTNNFALRANLVASSTLSVDSPTQNATDGSPATKWSSALSHTEWAYVDLGSSRTIDQVKLNWGTAYGQSYNIQVSTNAVTWSTVYSTTTGSGGVDTISLTPVTARYVRMQGVLSGTAGYSLNEFEVYDI